MVKLCGMSGVESVTRTRSSWFTSMTEGEKLYLRAATVNPRSPNSWARATPEAPSVRGDGDSHPTTNPMASAEAADARPRGLTPMGFSLGGAETIGDWAIERLGSPARSQDRAGAPAAAP